MGHPTAWDNMALVLLGKQWLGAFKVSRQLVHGLHAFTPVDIRTWIHGNIADINHIWAKNPIT
jgi:hypothetical protein